MKTTSRRDFMNSSLKAGALMMIPYSGFVSESQEMSFSDNLKNRDFVIRRTPLSTKDYLDYAKRFSNWGRWGNDDQFGTLNFIDDSKRKEAIKLVKTGKSISCGRPLDTVKAVDNPYPAEFRVGTDLKGSPWTEGRITIAIDFLNTVSHGYIPTHIDALNHVHTNDGRMYNGRPISDVKTTGIEFDAIEVWKDGIVSRGVLYDIPKLRGKRFITPDQPVQGWELEDCALKFNLKPKAGDIVIIDCGREKYFNENKDASRVPYERPGLDSSVLEFFFKYDAAVLGSDFDEAPRNKNYSTHVPLHAIANPYMGLPTLWNLDINRVRDKCTELDRNHFLFIINPLIIVGATASLVNPIAIF